MKISGTTVIPNTIVGASPFIGGPIIPGQSGPKIFRVNEPISQGSTQRLAEFLTSTFNSSLHNLAEGLKYTKKNGIFIPEVDEIIVEINSYGGYTNDGFAMYDMLKAIPSDVKLTTICTGRAASAASVIFCAGDDRIVTPGSEILMHQAYFGMLFNMKEEDMKAYTKSLELCNQRTLDIYAKATKRSKTSIKNDMKLTDFMLTGKQSVDYGIATALLNER